MDLSEQAAFTKPTALIGTFVGLSVVYFIAKAIYVLYFHPLSKVPGPKINALSRIPYARHLLAGSTVDNITALHDKYGQVVRVSPNEVSFISGESAWPEIYGFRTGKMKGHATMQKDPAWYPPPAHGTPSILVADDEDHSRARKLLTHAFSAPALAGQEILLHNYADQMVLRLKEVTAKSDEQVDMVKWYNWTTFDIIADMLFGEPFGCLQNLATHKYISLLFSMIEANRLFYIMKYFPIVKYAGSLVVDKSPIALRKEFIAWVGAQVEKRLARDTERPDFMTHIIRHNGEKETISQKEIVANSITILAAGSETTATLLSGVTYCLLKNPDTLQKLKDEVRGKFKTYSDITLEGVNNAPYLLAVLNEGLRFYPPVPVGFQRKVCQKGGEMVSGYLMPEGTGVSVSQYPAYHSEIHFKDADKFVPERWTGDPRYENDACSVLQPFSFGPRSCLGKNLAYAEMRIILAKIIWTFDLELDPRSDDWLARNKVFMLWSKPELAVKLTELERS